MAGSGGCWPALDQVGAGPQLKELDEINPESLRTDVTPAAYVTADANVASASNVASAVYMAPAASVPAEGGAAAADREHRAC